VASAALLKNDTRKTDMVKIKTTKQYKKGVNAADERGCPVAEKR